MHNTKVCRVCKIEKGLEQFHPNKSCKLGVVGTCKDCSADRIRGWYKENKDSRNKYYNERNKGKKRMAVERYGGKCTDCGGVFPLCVYEFHHLGPEQKEVNPSHLLTGNLEKAWAELDKCVLLCSNCHKIRHWGEEY